MRVGEFFQPDDVAAPIDLVEQLQGGDAGVRGQIPAPAVDQRQPERTAGQADHLLKVEVGLQADLPGLLGRSLQSAREIGHRLVDAAHGDVDAKITETSAKAAPIAKEMRLAPKGPVTVVGREKGRRREGRQHEVLGGRLRNGNET